MKAREIFDSVFEHYESKLSRGLSINELRSRGVKVNGKDGKTELFGDDGGSVIVSTKINFHDKTFEERPDTNHFKVELKQNGITTDSKETMLSDTELYR